VGKLLILAPAAIASVAASRGAGAGNLLSPSPKEVWQDSAAGSPATLDLDLGELTGVDTVFLGHVTPPAAGSSWTITGGVTGYAELTLKAAGALRAVDAAGRVPATSHALWTGPAAAVRYLRISVTQPAGEAPLAAGVVMAGAAFVPIFNQEWGAGRRPIDLSSVTQLPDGGFAVVEGARKRAYAWTLGDLSSAEVDRLDAMFEDRGESRPVLVVEDPAATVGQRNRIHYGLFRGLRAFERRNPAQTRWEMSMEEWA
jgi:hypothetical protein